MVMGEPRVWSAPLPVVSPVGQRLRATSFRSTPSPRAGPKIEPAGSAPRVTHGLYGQQGGCGSGRTHASLPVP